MLSPPGFRLFLSGSGSIGKVMTATRWKGAPYWRPYAYPNTGNSTAQAAVRKLFSQAHVAWKRDFLTKEVRDDWNRAASYSSMKMSGYDLFIASAYHAADNDPAVVFTNTYSLSGDHLDFAPAVLHSGIVPATSQNIDIWMGHNPSKQNHWDTRQFHAGIFSAPSFPGPSTYWIRMTSAGVLVSGLIRFVYKGP